MDGNRYLNTEIRRFGNSVIDSCRFNDVNVLCYEPRTCKSIRSFGKEFSDADAEKYYKICSTDSKNNSENNSFSITGIILGVIGFIIIAGLGAFIFIKKRRDKSNFDSKEGSGRVVFISNTQNSEINDMNSLPINNNHAQELPPSYDENDMIMNSTSNIEENEQLPEYTEFNNLIR